MTDSIKGLIEMYGEDETLKDIMDKEESFYFGIYVGCKFIFAKKVYDIWDMDGIINHVNSKIDNDRNNMKFIMTDKMYEFISSRNGFDIVIGDDFNIDKTGKMDRNERYLFYSDYSIEDMSERWKDMSFNRFYDKETVRELTSELKHR